MMNMKKKRTFIQSVVTIILLSLMVMAPAASFAETRQKSALLNYSINLKIAGEGSLYWDYGENMAFFLKNDAESYNSKCRVNNDSNYSFSKVLNRGLIPQPHDGHYFAGFYNEKGKKVNLTKTTIDILRVSVNGIYYYDYYEAFENAKFKNYTQTAYKNKVKSYLKTLYGTSRYKVMGSTVLYQVPKKNAAYTAKFEKKNIPDVKINSEITKIHGDKKFYIITNRPSSYIYTFKSSNRNVVTVEKSTGYTTIKAPGTAVVTCSIPETETTLPAEWKTTITVKPANVIKFKASQSKKSLSLTWKKQSKNSGYEIQVSNNQSFETILASKTIRSAKADSAKLKLKTELFHNYARIRAYKLSKGNKIYSEYTVVKIDR